MFKNKLVAVLNGSIEPGVVMNALAHMSIGLGGALDSRDLILQTYTTKEKNDFPNISAMPFIILKGNSNKIKALVQEARVHKIIYTAFIDTMTGGTYLEQLDNTLAKKEDDLIFYGVTLFGDWETVSGMTRKFSLWR